MKRRTLRAIGPTGPLAVTGQVAKALAALVLAGGGGVTALEVHSWAYRLGAYVQTLRREFGLGIKTVRERHEGGWRYVLRCRVAILEPVS